MGRSKGGRLATSINAIPASTLVVTALGIGALAVNGQLRGSGDHPSPGVALLHVAGGLTFILVGLQARRLRPDNSTGLLMAAVGFTWFIGDLRWTGLSIAVTIADLTDVLYLAILGHLVLAYPSGRLDQRDGRTLTALIYLWVVASNAVTHLLAAANPACPCGQDLLVVHRDPGLHDIANQLQNLGNIALVLAVLAVFIRHRTKASPVGRRALDPVLWSSGPILIAVVALNAVNVYQSLHPLGTVLPWITPLALMTLPFSFLAGQLRSSLARLAVGDLLEELNRPAVPGRLRELLARTFGDPSLRVAYWIAESERYVDERGAEVEVPEPAADSGVTMLDIGGKPAAAIIHDPSLTEDPGLLRTVSLAARLSVENERLHAAVRAQLAEVRASRTRIVQAADEARRGLERDLHDGAQQRLVSLAMTLSQTRAAAADARGPQMEASLSAASQQLALALQELRELAAGIHPAVLTQGGLAAALEDLVERSPIPATLSLSGGDGVSPPLQATAYFVVSEAIANAGKHAQATTLTVNVARRSHRLTVEVIDDGRGGANDANGSGLRGLADRVAALDGSLTLESPAGGGTRIIVEMPCD